MKNAKLQFDDVYTAYLQYAAMIDGKTVENFVAKLRQAVARATSEPETLLRRSAKVCRADHHRHRGRL